MSDTELMQQAYDTLQRAFGMRYPEDADKKRAYLLSRTLVKHAMDVLEAPFRQGDGTLFRLDPDGCGCTDCLTGESVPYDRATEAQVVACALGKLVNATGRELTIKLAVDAVDA